MARRSKVSPIGMAVLVIAGMVIVAVQKIVDGIGGITLVCLMIRSATQWASIARSSETGREKYGSTIRAARTGTV